MSAPSNLTCLWPGLPHLWWRGDWRGLGIAIGFGAVLNLFWIGTFVWPELLPANVRSGGWLVLCVIWAVAIWHGRRSLLEWANGHEIRSGDTLFIRAQTEYLQGNWYEAESLLQEAVREDRRDADSGLMLAAIYRRRQRYDEAREMLDRLSRMETADRWCVELRRERQLLGELEPDTEANIEELAEHSGEPALPD